MTSTTDHARAPRPAPAAMTIPPVPGRENEPPLVADHGLTKSYRGRPALADLHLELPAGRITGLMGANGCGKTTLLKILAGVLSDYERTVAIGGRAPGPETKAQVAFLPDAAYLDERWRPEDAVAYFERFFPDFDVERARSLIGFFRLPEDRSVKEMSKGMGEKLRISLTMARRARVYLLDEPISGIDPAAREVLLDGILRDFDPNALLLLSTHLIADVECVLDSAVLPAGGRLRLAGDADHLRQVHGMSLDALFRKEFRS